jgi:uncharacterized protein DUF4381
MMQGSDPATLALRDIHLPNTVLWWPLAPGWWVLLLTIIFLFVSIFYLIRRRKNYHISTMYLARQELEKIKIEFKVNQDKSILIKELSELIRRVSISLFKRDESASLTGQDWLLFLDQLNGDTSFSQGVGRILIEAPYQANPNYEANELLHLISSWIESANQSRNHK